MYKSLQKKRAHTDTNTRTHTKLNTHAFIMHTGAYQYKFDMNFVTGKFCLKIENLRSFPSLLRKANKIEPTVACADAGCVMCDFMLFAELFKGTSRE